MSKIIKLTHGQETSVDDKNYEYLSQWVWSAQKHRDGDFYASRKETINGKRFTYLMHREILGCTLGDGKIVDHINRNKLCNEEYNLRICTRAQNASNRGAQVNNVTNIKGVKLEEDGKWVARLLKRFPDKNKTIYHLGRYTNRYEAAAAYDIKAKEIQGEFALLNNLQVDSKVKEEDEQRIRDIKEEYSKKRIEAIIAKSTSGYLGVTWNNNDNKWKGSVTSSNGRIIHVGTFSDKKEAAKTVDVVALHYKGSSAYLNFPNERFGIEKERSILKKLSSTYPL